MSSSKGIVVMAGASGFMGGYLEKAFTRDGFVVRTIGRGERSDARWDEDLVGVLDGADVLVNMAGRSVSCRYTKKTADEIFSSRTETTRRLGEALSRCHRPPSVWLNASTGTIYRDARDRPQNETTGELGTGFSVAVARAWERELFEAPTQVRKVALRTSIALGAGGGALNPLINLARLGFSGPQGDGDQIVSWIHLDDVYGAIRHIMAETQIEGPVNVTSPNPVTNRELTAAVRRHFAVGLPARGIPLPRWSLEFGGRVIRTEPELVLKSRWSEPGVLLASGYAFARPHLDGALAKIAKDTPRGLLRVQLG